MNTVKRKVSARPKKVDERCEKVTACIYGDTGLVPVIIQDYESGEVLSLVYMNEEAINATFESGYVHYYNNETSAVEKKGEGTGNTQKVVSAFFDNKKASLLIKVNQKGVADEEAGTFSAYEGRITGTQNAVGGVMLGKLQRIILENKKNPEEDSYTSFLLTKGVDKIAKKVGEEAVELVIASKNDSKAEIVDEASDFLYHMMVLLAAKGVKFSDVCAELWKRNR
jgi:phosphoribosyl-ATP pyrophosphohydrolase/phosphoribosyl-AMP cyclohydrolase